MQNEDDKQRVVLQCVVCGLVQYAVSICRKCRKPMMDAQIRIEETPQAIAPVKGLQDWQSLRRVLADSLHTYRSAMGYSMAALERRAGCRHSWVSKYEGVDPVQGSIAMIEKIADALHIPLFWLLESPSVERTASIFATQVLLAVRKAQIDKQAVLDLIVYTARQNVLRKVG